MNYRLSLILMLLGKFSGERTVHSVYHLLKGKKTSQTIQDAKLFNVEIFFATMNGLTRSQFDSYIKKLIQYGYITISDDNFYCLTSNGRKFVDEVLKDFELPKHINGLLYSSVSRTFWERFSLFVQVLSQSTMGNKRYSAIIINEKAAWWVKQHMPNASKRAAVTKATYKECMSLLENLSDLEAKIFTMRLSRANRIGYTSEQIANKLKLDGEEVHYLFQSAIHYIAEQVLNNKKGFPILASFFDEDSSDITLTKTAQESKNLLQLGNNISDVMKIRNLKRSTIEDHIVELASIERDFSIDKYVSQNEQDEINQAINKTGMKKLKAIKENTTSENITYFKIRLVLARGVFNS